MPTSIDRPRAPDCRTTRSTPSSDRDPWDRWKDTVANVDATGEFVWNLATRSLAMQMNATSASRAAERDEFDDAGLNPVPSAVVSTPRVLESPVNFECPLLQLIRLQRADGTAVDTWLVLSEVVAVHIDRALLTDGDHDTARPHPILRAGGPASYAEISPDAMFEMARPS